LNYLFIFSLFYFKFRRNSPDSHSDSELLVSKKPKFQLDAVDAKTEASTNTTSSFGDEIVRKEIELEKRENEQNLRAKELEERNAELKERERKEIELEKRENEQNLRAKELEERNAELKERERLILEKEKQFNEKWKNGIEDVPIKPSRSASTEEVPITPTRSVSSSLTGLSHAQKAKIKYMAKNTEVQKIGDDGFAIITRDFVKQLEESTPGLIDRMEIFFSEMKPLMKRGRGTVGDNKFFNDIFFKDLFSHANPQTSSPTLVLFQREITQLAYHFLVELTPFVKKSCPSLFKSLTEMKNNGLIRKATFGLQYRQYESSAGNNGLNPHCDDAGCFGALILGGTKIPKSEPCLRIFPTMDYEEVLNSPIWEGEMFDVSYSLGDLVFFNGNYTHSSFIPVKDRVMYCQFLAIIKKQKTE
jgi:hypothetical protein